MSKYKRKIKMRHLISNTLDLPEYIAITTPQITLVENSMLLAENYMTVEEYTNGRIALSGKDIIMTVEGNSLVLDGVIDERVYITGDITGIYFEVRHA